MENNSKHMMCDICKIKKTDKLKDVEFIKHLLTVICIYNNFTIIDKIVHDSPNGISVVYILPQSHILIHTFPDSDHISFDLYSSDNNQELFKYIYGFLVTSLGADIDHSKKTFFDRY
jgi:S-adenosylmethionine/arginine decarboxylase-like enzyme